MTVRVAVAGAGDVVSAGLRSLLSCRDIELVPPGARVEDADVVLYDVIGMRADGGEELWRIIASGVPVLALGRPLRPDLAARAVVHGARATMPTEAGAGELVAAIEAIAAGRPIPAQARALSLAPDTPPLTPREVEVLTGVTQGLSNAEICARLHVRLNTVKSVIRNAYRKMGVTTRAQAVSWCLQHGFEPASDDGLEAGQR